MIVRILIWLGVFIVISLFVLWIVSGGIGKTIGKVKTFADSPEDGTSMFGSFRLPWQPESFNFGPEFSDSADYSYENVQTVEQELASLQKEYEHLEDATRAALDFGTPSPFRDMVHIDGTGETLETKPDVEHLRLVASWNNTVPVDITGWSLQSAVTGVRVHIPRGAYDFRMGFVNEQKNIQLNAGASVIITSGGSPVGTSFRENTCSGYLNQFQSFSPPLPEHCPYPSEAVPLSAENLNLYGDACVDLARTLPTCRVPISYFTSELSQPCRSFLANTLSYNGCIDTYRYRANFTENLWRVYLNSPRELWRNTHDVIRLLDAKGRTVDALAY